MAAAGSSINLQTGGSRKAFNRQTTRGIAAAADQLCGLEYQQIGTLLEMLAIIVLQQVPPEGDTSSTQPVPGSADARLDLMASVDLDYP